MDWRKEALGRARRARLCANNLHRKISDVKVSLYVYDEFDDEHALMVDTMKGLEDTIAELFEIEGKLSQPQNVEGKAT